MKPSNENIQDTTIQRLPCRGCTSACSNYHRCEGRPWRMTGAPENKSANADSINANN